MSTTTLTKVRNDIESLFGSKEEINKLPSKDIREQLSKLNSIVEASYLHMGGLLFRVKFGKLFSGWGFSDFNDYCDTEIGWKPRKAEYHISIWKKMRVDFGLTDEDMNGVSWTKAAEISSAVNTKSDAIAMLKKAKGMTNRELKIELAKKKVGKRAPAAKTKGGDVEVSEFISFSLFPEQEQNVKTAIEVAGQLAKSSKEGHLLDMIALEFLGNHLESMDETLEGWVERLEETYGVAVVVIKDKAIADKIAAVIDAED